VRRNPGRLWRHCSAEPMQYSLIPELADAELSNRLLIADPGQWPVDGSWRSIVDDFFEGAAGRQLLGFLQSRLDAGAVVFPSNPLRALALTPARGVRVVILGQDPYHGRGQAEGLAFSVASGVAVPPSLRNIFKEIVREGGAVQSLFPLSDGSLMGWAERGVLLLNTCLTVEEGQPASHSGLGWERLTDGIIRHVAASDGPVVFMLWGAQAQSKRQLIDESRHLVLVANHPSPLSAARPPLPFNGCGHFSQALAWLRAQDAQNPTN